MGFVFLLGAMAAVPAVTIDMYLPSLPEVAAELSASDSQAAGTITGMLIGAALGQLLVGSLSDTYGRKAPFAVGLTIHTLTSLACIWAPTILGLISLRVLQGVGNAAASVTAMAMIRDRFEGARAAAIMSRLMLVIGLAPLLAPTIGGLIATQWSWRIVFAFLAGYGAFVLIATVVFMPETHPKERRSRTSLPQAFRGYALLLADRQFMALAVLPGLGLAVLMTYVSASPFVLRAHFGLTESQFALLFAINGLALIVGTQVNAQLVRGRTPITILRWVMPLEMTMALAVVLIALGFDSLIGVSIPLWIMLALNSIVMPNATAMALSRHGARAGSAAAVVGASQYGLAGVIAPAAGVLGASAVSMGSLIAVVALVGYLLVRTVADPDGA